MVSSTFSDLMFRPMSFIGDIIIHSATNNLGCSVTHTVAPQAASCFSKDKANTLSPCSMTMYLVGADEFL